MNPYSLLPLISSLLFLILGVYVFIKGKDQVINRVFFLLYLLTALWQGTWTILFNTQDPTLAYLLVRIGYSWIIFLPIGLLHFVSAWLQLPNQRRVIRLSYLISFIFLIVLWTTKYFVSGYYTYYWGYYPKASVFHVIYMIFMIILITRMHIILFFEICSKKYTPMKRLQLKYLLAVMLIYSLAAMDFLVNYGIEFYPFGVIPIMISLLLLMYSTLRYHLLDIRLVISKAVIFIVVYLPILLIPIFLMLWKRELLETVLGKHFWLFPTITEGLLVIVGLSLYKTIEAKAEKKLLHEEYEHESSLRKIADTILQQQDLEVLSKRIVDSCYHAIKMEYIALYLLNDQEDCYEQSSSKGIHTLTTPTYIDKTSKLLSVLYEKYKVVLYEELVQYDKEISSELELLRGIMAVPIIHAKQLIGVLIVGEKQNHKIFTHVELMAFNLLSRQIALEIVHIRFIQQMRRIEIQLNEARRMKEFGYLLNSLGHEIRNEISSVQMGVFMMITDPKMLAHIDQSKDKEQQESLNEMMSHLENMKKLMDELTHFMVREDPGTLKKVDVHKIVESVLTVQKIRNKEFKNMEVQVKGNVVVLANDTQVQTVLHNMLNNSYDAIMKVRTCGMTPDPLHQGKIEIEMLEKDTMGHIYIRDNGCGITDENQQQLYTFLFTTKGNIQKKELREEDRTGIGMHKIREIMRSYGGEIEVVKSTPNQGCEFLLTLPLYKDKTVQE